MLDFLRNRRRSEHEWVEESLSAYIDGELSAKETARVEEHLRECQACTENLATLRQTVALLRELPTLAPPRSFTVRPAPVRLQARAAAPAWGYGLLKGATALAALLLVLLIGGDLALQFLGGFRLAVPAPLAPAAEVALAPSPLPRITPVVADEELMVGEGKAMDTPTAEATALTAEEVPAPAGAPTEAPHAAYQAPPPEETASPERERAEGADWAGTPTPSATPAETLLPQATGAPAPPAAPPGTPVPEGEEMGRGAAEPTATATPTATPEVVAMADRPVEEMEARGEAHLQPQTSLELPLRLAELVVFIILLLLIPATLVTGWLLRRRGL